MVSLLLGSNIDGLLLLSWSNRKFMLPVDRFFFQFFPIFKKYGPMRNQCPRWTKTRKFRGPPRASIFYRTEFCQTLVYHPVFCAIILNFRLCVPNNPPSARSSSTSDFASATTVRLRDHSPSPGAIIAASATSNASTASDTSVPSICS